MLAVNGSVDGAGGETCPYPWKDKGIKRRSGGHELLCDEAVGHGGGECRRDV